MPALTIAESPNSLGTVEALKTNKTFGLVLRDVSDCVVLHVTENPAEILVTALAAGAITPSIRVDKVTLGEPAAKPAESGAGTPRKLVVSAKGVSLVGHIERTGDVAVGEGQVLGDPSANHRVEGFQIMWPDKPAGVELAYCVSVEGYGAMPVVGTGTFTGTRGEAKRITEVTFALTGPNAKKYELAGTVYFSGGFQVPVSSGTPLGGPSGLEHLTGIELKVRPAAAAKAKASGVWEESPKTKVFSAKKTAVPAKASAAKKTVATKTKSRKAK